MARLPCVNVGHNMQEEYNNTTQQTLPPPRKVALVHYWLLHMRGGEKVLEALCRMYPEAHIYTHVVNKEKLSPLLQSRVIHTTFIQRLPKALTWYQKYLPLMPLALEQLDLTDYDLIISSESGPAKGVLTRADATHVCYCHSPMRYLWDFYPQYLASASSFVRLAMRVLFSSLRQWDVLSAQRVDYIVANSATVRKRIAKHWRRKAHVVHPPVDMQRFHLSTETREDFYFCMGQLVDYKRVDIAIEACLRLKKRLVIVGDGEMRKRYEALVQQLATDAAHAWLIEFKGRMDDAGVQDLYNRCAALLFPGEEDFGIVPLEAMATGAPVLAYGKGGATETVLDGETGFFFHEQNAEAMAQCIQRFESVRHEFSAQRIRNHAMSFDEERFSKEMFHHIEQARVQVAQY